MVYGPANLSATELADLALDKPLLGANLIPLVPTLERWNHEGTTAGADHTASGYPIHRAHDGTAEFVTKPDSALATWYLVFNFGTTVDVDFCGIGPGHNLGTCALTSLSIDFDQNQNGAFGAVHSCDLVASFPMSSNDRIMQLDLDHAAVGTAQRFSDVQYCRIKMGAGGVITPQITEVIIGARYQMPRWPNRPFNPDNIRDISETSDPTKGGGTDKTVYAQNQFMLDAEWTMKHSETAALKTWWKQTGGSFVWVWQPSTAPESYHLITRNEDRLELPYEGREKHSFALSGVEQGPEARFLENE